jgi:pteridine reductase
MIGVSPVVDGHEVTVRHEVPAQFQPGSNPVPNQARPAGERSTIMKTANMESGSMESSNTESTSLPVPRGPAGTVVVTGASHRVGRAIALEFARLGYGLVLTYRSRPSECAETVRRAIEVGSAHGHAIAVESVALDLADTAAAERFAEGLAARCRAQGAAIDAIVHNASAYEPTALRGISAAAVESMHRVEVVSPLLVTERLGEALAASRLAGGGAVVFFSDMYAIGRARAGFTPYMLAKAGVETLARQLAVELAPRVRVHCVAPGVILWPEGFPEETKQAILAHTPLGRAGTAEEAARLVRFLALEASFMTGGTIAIDGGRGLR